MPIRQRFSAAYRAFRHPDLLEPANGRDQGAHVFGVVVPDDPRERYELLEMYRENRVYRDLRLSALRVAAPADFDRIRALENPALQAVQFGVMHVFPGSLQEALPIEAEGNPTLALAAGQVLEMGNMGAQKDSIVEDVYSLGDVFLKAVPKEDDSAVFPESRHPGEVTEFREDNQRNTVYIRLDVAIAEDERTEYGGAKWWTEVWDKRENSYRSWLHDRGPGAKLDTLGQPYEDNAITDFGHDFVPFVRAPFEAGARPNRRSRAVFELHLEPIDQLNRIASELDEMYRDNAEGVWAALRSEAGKDAIEMLEDEEEEEAAEPEEHEAHGRRIVRFPGMSRMEDLVPSIDYKAGLEKIEDRRRALERSLAELRYFRGIEGGDPAAAAIRQHQAPAIRRAEAAKGNAENAVLRVVKMCLSMGQSRGIFGRDIGSFDADRFKNLAFEKRAIVPETPQEKAERQKNEAELLQLYKNIGIPEVLEEALIERGFSEADARRIAGESAQRQERARASSIVNQLGGAV